MSLPEPALPRQVPTRQFTVEWKSRVKTSQSTRLRNAVAALFALAAGLLGVATIWALVWAGLNEQPLGVALALIWLGLAIALGYEAWAVRPGSHLETISEIANRAFMAHRSTWMGIHLTISLVIGLLTMHFTRLVQQQPEWGFLAVTVLVLVNGALIAYWFEWLP